MMKIIVDELPKTAKECPFYTYDVKIENEIIGHNCKLLSNTIFCRNVKECKFLTTKEKPSKIQLSALKQGDIFKIGEWDFIVLKHTDEGTYIISKDLLLEDIYFGESKDYNASNLKTVIEKEIQPILVKEIGEDNIIEQTVELTTVDNQKEFKDVVCKVRPLTFDEAREFNSLLVNKELSDWWWTLTPWSSEDRGFRYSITVVSPCGSIDYYVYNGDRGVRPFCILKSDIFVSKGE